MSNPAQSLPPGFRFHPTDEELILHYLRNRAASTPCPVSIIAEVDIYKFDPWDLPGRAMFGDREWYFFSPRDRKYPNGIRPNRAAASGYWKATGTDKPIHASSIGNENIGVKKALVFYKGRPPKGQKTNWIMHEYRLADASPSNCYRPMKLRDTSMRLDDWVLCRIYKKSSSIQTVEPSMIVAEAEDSGAEDPYASTSQNIPLVPESSLKLHKSFSVSEFLEDYSALSHLFDNLPETPTMDNSKQPFANSSHGNANDINYLVHQLSQGGSSASLAGNYMKRQRPVDEGVVAPPKKRNDSCNFTSFAIGNQLDLPQYNMMSQLLLNSHLGLH